MGTTFSETIGSRTGLNLHVVIETSDDGGTTWETTNWGTRCQDYGSIEKSMESWTGRFKVGEVTLRLIDEDLEIYGSFSH